MKHVTIWLLYEIHVEHTVLHVESTCSMVRLSQYEMTCPGMTFSVCVRLLRAYRDSMSDRVFAKDSF